MDDITLIAYRGPIAVTVAMLALWYGLLLGLQRGRKYALLAEYAARGEVFDRYRSQDGRMLAADRAVANTQEQMVPFLAALWLYATVVSPAQATVLGTIYVALRAVYPFLLGANLGNTQSKRVFFATGPCYAIIFGMLGTVVFRAFVVA